MWLVGWLLRTALSTEPHGCAMRRAMLCCEASSAAESPHPLCRPSHAPPRCACRENTFKEIDILCLLDDPHIAFLKEYFVEHDKVCSILSCITPRSSACWLACVAS